MLCVPSWWRAGGQQEATRIELPTQKSGCVPEDDEYDATDRLLRKVKAEDLVKASHLASPTSCTDRYGKLNTVNENERAIPTQRKGAPRRKYDLLQSVFSGLLGSGCGRLRPLGYRRTKSWSWDSKDSQGTLIMFS